MTLRIRVLYTMMTIIGLVRAIDFGDCVRVPLGIIWTFYWNCLNILFLLFGVVWIFYYYYLLLLSPSTVHVQHELDFGGYLRWLIRIARTLGVGDCLIIGIIQTIILGNYLQFGIVRTIDVGDCLLNGIVRAIYLGACLLSGIVRAIDRADCL